MTGGAVTYTYDPVTGQKKSLMRPNGVETTWTHDARGNIDTIVHQLGQTVLLRLDYDWDHRGLITTTTETRKEVDPSTVIWSYTYDAQKRLISAIATDTRPATYYYTYDLASNRTSRTANGVTTTYTCNFLGQLVTERTGQTEQTYTWDNYGNLWKEIEGETLKREYTWDARNRLRSVRLLEPEERIIAFTYDDEGTRAQRKDRLSGGGASRDAYYLADYENPTGYSQTIRESHADDKTDQVYSWDATGLLSQRTSQSGSVEHVHCDQLGSVRLIPALQGAVVAGSGFNYSPFGLVITGEGKIVEDKFAGQLLDSAINLQYHRKRWYRQKTDLLVAEDPVYDFSGFGHSYLYDGSNTAGIVSLSG